MASNTKLELQETAIRLFQEHGYDKVSVNQICKECNVSKTTFYFHYKSKHDLIMDFYSNVHEDSKTALQSALTSTSAIEQLWYLLIPYFKHSVEKGVAITREVFREYLCDTTAPILPGNIYLESTMKDLIKKGISEGEIQNSDEDTLFFNLISAINGVTLHWAISNGEFDLIAKSKQVIYDILKA